MDKMILTNRLPEFIDELYVIKSEELNDKYNWEYFLHRVFDKSFNEFISEQGVEPSGASEHIETTVKQDYDEIIQHSKNMLKGFTL